MQFQSVMFIITSFIHLNYQWQHSLQSAIPITKPCKKCDMTLSSLMAMYSVMRDIQYMMQEGYLWKENELLFTYRQHENIQINWIWNNGPLKMDYLYFDTHCVQIIKCYCILSVRRLCIITTRLLGNCGLPHETSALLQVRPLPAVPHEPRSRRHKERPNQRLRRLSPRSHLLAKSSKKKSFAEENLWNQPQEERFSRNKNEDNKQQKRKPRRQPRRKPGRRQAKRQPKTAKAAAGNRGKKHWVGRDSSDGWDFKSRMTDFWVVYSWDRHWCKFVDCQYFNVDIRFELQFGFLLNIHSKCIT